MMNGTAGIPGRAQTDPEKRKWRDEECPRQAEQSPLLPVGSHCPCAKRPRRNCDRCKVNYSGSLIDSRDAKGVDAGDNES